ncbi:uncharacterized protein LOC132601391 [Lycium barbarum]|uniref:uncharacterized protein LOC132601391 n=1 Tax=Lycium barbarum TaxID=112863 RepID=UPI00293E7B1A|nr:uncharacterized protein LOC132601391 [Lycium barbarum]
MVFGGKPRMDLLQFGNWSKLGALHDLIPIHCQNEILGEELEELMSESHWNYAKLQEVLPANIVDNVRKEVGHFVRTNEIDKPWWILISSDSLVLVELSNYCKVETFISSNSYIDFMANLEEQEYHEVKWNFPDRRCFKCNTDGASKGNPGQSSAVFCIRDSSGEFIYAMASLLTNTTNLVAKAMAIEEGIKYCVLRDLLLVIVETDSLTMQKVLDGIWEVPWNIALIVRSIQIWMKDKDVSMVHVFREGNCVAEYFTNLFLILQCNSIQ